MTTDPHRTITPARMEELPTVQAARLEAKARELQALSWKYRRAKALQTMCPEAFAKGPAITRWTAGTTVTLKVYDADMVEVGEFLNCELPAPLKIPPHVREAILRDKPHLERKI